MSDLLQPTWPLYLLLKLNHLLLLQKEVADAVFVGVSHQSVSVVGAQLGGKKDVD